MERVGSSFFTRTARASSALRYMKNFHRDRAGVKSIARRAYQKVIPDADHFSVARKYGLYDEDEWYTMGYPMDREAAHRLPEDESTHRLYRGARHQSLYQKKAFLPKDQWTTKEADAKQTVFMDRLIIVIREEEDRDLFHNN